MVILAVMSQKQLIEGGDVTAATLAERVAAAVGDGALQLIIDLGDRDVDAAILRVLVLTDHVARAGGGRVVLCSGAPARTTLRATGLDLYLSSANSLEDARALVQAPL